ERPSEFRRLVNCRIDQRSIAQIVRKLRSQGSENLGVGSEAAILENGLDDSGQGVAVAAVIHLGDSSTDAKKNAPPISIADRVAKTAIDTDAKCSDQTKANDCRGQPREQADHAGAVRHTSRANSQYGHLDQSSRRALPRQSEHRNDRREGSRSLISVAGR